MKRLDEGPLDGVVRGVLAKLGKDGGALSEEEITSIWKGVVGEAAAGHSRPASMKKSTLVINVDGSSWLYELTLKKREILKGLAERIKKKKIKDIRLRIGEVK